MSAQLPAAALRSMNEKYKKLTGPRVFALDAGRHWGQRSPKLTPEQLGKSLQVVHEQYQRGYRGRRLRRHAAMRMAPHCNTNSVLFLVLPSIAAQLIRLYQRWRSKEGITDPSGVFTARGGSKRPHKSKRAAS
ncbi:MAG: hypothetical protein AAF596_03965 [Planctomycetota bacterium]